MQVKRLIVTSAVVAVALTGCTNQPSTNGQVSPSNSSQSSENKSMKDYTSYKDAKELQTIDYQPGTGSEASKVDDTITVHYSGFLTDGTPFDSSRKRGQPFSFVLGENRVIQGWEQGLLGKRVGDKFTLVIPASLGYGSRPNASIPANSVLVFEIEVMGIKPGVTISPAKDYSSYKDSKELQTIDYTKGNGKSTSKAGDAITVHYSGFLTDGSLFDSSKKRDQPFTFTLGEKSVIEGWEKGLMDRHEGDKFTLIIPYQMGYGESGNSSIPGKSTLVFEIEVLSIKSK